LISCFENDNNKRGFTISKVDKILISPQEYIAARLQLIKQDLKEINFTFVGGCFPVQHNIIFEDLFHQKLKKKVEEFSNVSFNINIIRYERYNNCFNKIVAYSQSERIDLLVFHIRPEPYLRLVKFFYKYVNNNGRLRYSFNIPILKLINPEKYDFLIIGRQYNRPISTKSKRLHRVLINMNYRTGKFFGNTYYAQKKHSELITNIINYCKNSNIKLILLGPALRSNTSYEPLLCEELNNSIRKSLTDKNISYIDCLEQFANSQKQLFHENGIHAREQYHELIAEKIYSEIEKMQDCNT
jgi:hypothetical protein